MLVVNPALVAQHGGIPDAAELSHWPTLSLPASGDHYCWCLKNGKKSVEIVHTPRFIADDMFALKRAALDGVGVAQIPEETCSEELGTGKLQVVAERGI